MREINSIAELMGDSLPASGYLKPGMVFRVRVGGKYLIVFRCPSDPVGLFTLHALSEKGVGIAVSFVYSHTTTISILDAYGFDFVGIWKGDWIK